MDNINFVKVESSNIEKVGHDNEDLYVTYKSGNTYKYLGVPKEVYNNLLESESKGRFMNSAIKENYKYTKVDISQ